MKYFHCPKTYRGKAYGCGRGPYNATQACLDLWGKCPCGKELKPYKPERKPPVMVRAPEPTQRERDNAYLQRVLRGEGMFTVGDLLEAKARGFRPPSPNYVHAECAVESVTGERYCHEPTAEGPYCRRHAYLNHSAQVHDALCYCSGCRTLNREE